MGAAQSVPQRDEVPTARRSGPSLRRRISSFIRGDGASASKRERSNSVQTPRAGQKRRRIDGSDRDDIDVDDDAATRQQRRRSDSDGAAYRGTRSEDADALSTPGAGPSRHDTPASRSQSRSPRLGSDTDDLLSERMGTISTIQDALGPEWQPPPPPAPAPPGVERLLARFRRSSTPASSAVRAPTPTPPLSASNSSTTTAASVPRSISHRLSAIMGFASPGSAPANDEWSEAQVSPEASAASAASVGADPAATSAPAADATATEDDPAESGRIPVGAVLVIQGLAQTHANLEQDETGPNGRRRRASEGSAARPRIDVPSLDQQARMIGNLLTVAAAATATTLLSPESLAQTPSRSTAQNAMQTIIERLRPQRNRASQSVESALGDYLRSVLRDNRRFAEAVTDGAPPSANIPAAFQEFLHTLQDDLIRAVRAYAVPDWDETQEIVTEESEQPPAASTAASSRVSVVSAPTSDVSMADATASVEAPASSAPSAPTDAAPEAIPAFHRQPGQHSAAARALGVSGGTEGVPRRLNFFRAHLFPTVRADGSTVQGNEDPDAVVPSIFVGVRSISHDPNMTTEDLVGHPSFPFLDGQVPEGTEVAQAHGTAASSLPIIDTATTTSATETTTTTTASATVAPEDDYQFDRDLERELRDTASMAASQPRRSFRERVLERFSRRESRSSAPLNTYLIYVIGGNYPRSHPVLAIPSLVSGGPLTAEDLQLVSELLGPAKPPTATKEDIERSGLQVVKSVELTALNTAGHVTTSSLERCMVCLSDYEPEEDCRILACRHAFHMECVDHWIREGRNSCPTCRSEAVIKAPAAAAAPPAEGEAVDEVGPVAVPVAADAPAPA